MAHYTSGAKTICPFYLRETERTIPCEGVSPDRPSKIRFAHEGEKRRFQKQNCELFDYGRSCPMAAALREKYKTKE